MLQSLLKKVPGPIKDRLNETIQDRWKMTAFVNGFSVFKLPLLAFITPEFLEFSDEKTVIKVRLGYRSRNHLNVMYFGALAMGAELSVAGAAVSEIQKSGKRIDFLFKNFESQFLKRADGHVIFTCSEAAKVRALIQKAAKSSERMEETFHGSAHVEGKEDLVMKYTLTLSVKHRAS